MILGGPAHFVFLWEMPRELDPGKKQLHLMLVYIRYSIIHMLVDFIGKMHGNYAESWTVGSNGPKSAHTQNTHTHGCTNRRMNEWTDG